MSTEFDPQREKALCASMKLDAELFSGFIWMFVAIPILRRCLWLHPCIPFFVEVDTKEDVSKYVSFRS